ncbi:MAG: hypothetical protein V1701_10140 [Planctomycetota bacterium]
MLKPNEVKTANIATYAITESRIAPSAVTTDKIADGNVTEKELKDGSVTTTKLKDKCVTNDKIADKTITQDKLVLPIIPPSPITRPISPAVTSAELADACVTRAKIAIAAVENDNIKNLNVTGEKLASSSVTTTKIADGAVTGDKLAETSIKPSKLAAVNTPTDGQALTYEQSSGKFKYVTPSGGGITRPITPGITGNEITDQAVSETKIADLAVTSGKIADSCVKPSKLASANAPSNGAVLTYNESGSNFQWIGASGGDMLTLLQSQTQIFTDQSANNVDQIVDLPGFIPPVVKAVILEIQFNAMSVPSGLEQQLWVYGRRAGTDWGSSTIHFIWQNIANLNNNVYKEAIVATDADRKVRVIINKNGQFCSNNIWIRGYIE